MLTPYAPGSITPLNHPEKFINHLLGQVLFLREQIKSKDLQINSLLKHASRRDDISLSRKSSLLPANVNQTNIEQISDQEQIPNTPPILAPKKNHNREVIIIGSNETFPICNRIALVPEKEFSKHSKNNNSSKKT